MANTKIEQKQDEFYLEIYREYSPENPFKWDEMPLIAVNSIDGFRKSLLEDYPNFKILNYLADKVTLEMVKDKAKELVILLEDYFPNELDFYEEDIDDIHSDICGSILSIDNVKDISKVADYLNVTNFSYLSRGYSQGDATEVIIIFTEDFIKLKGLNNDKEIEKSLYRYSNLFDSYLWGDVYEFFLYKKRYFTKTYENGETEDSFEWELYDSCGGFYGDNFEDNGMLDYIGEEHRELLNNTEISY